MKKSNKYIYLCVCVLLIAAFAVLSVRSAISVGNMALTYTNDSNAYPNIIIDPGHGGEDGGASSDSGLLEKDVTLKIAEYLKAFFEQSGFTVTLTRDGDFAIYEQSAKTLREKKISDLEKRAELCNSSSDNVYISIHLNKFEQSKYKGAQVFYSTGNEMSKPLAEAIQTTLKSLLQKDNGRKIKPSDSSIYILDRAEVPSVLVECGFLSNYDEALLLSTDAYQKQLAFSIFSGFLDYYCNFT